MWFRRAIIGTLFALVICAPHSIAATQAAWVCALLLWVMRFTVRPRPSLYRTPVDYALLGFFAFTIFSALFSYDPITSLGKLRGASLFTIAYLVVENVTSRRVLRLLALMLIASCMVTVIYTIGERAIGRGVKINGLTADSPLHIAGIQNGDTLLEVNGRPLHNPDELERALAGNSSSVGPALLRVYRLELMLTYEVPRGHLLDGATPLARLGIASWSRGRDQRASGFYGHYTTYAEVLQLIASLALGLLVAQRHKWSWTAVLLAVSVAGFSIALLFTVTRASWLAFLLSAVVIVLVGAASRRAILVVALGMLLVIPTGLYVLQQKRHVSFFDRSDWSTKWRVIVYREGFHLLTQQPRHLLVGVGMDSIKRYWREWGLFDKGRLPIGHMHSTPLQIALERGLPTLLFWLALIIIYARMLWRLTRGGQIEEWFEHGIALGALGGLIGFFTSGLVHYNLGDSEVAIVFYLIMGLALAVERLTRKQSATTLKR